MYFLSTSKHARTLPDVKDDNGLQTIHYLGAGAGDGALAHDALANKGELYTA